MKKLESLNSSQYEKFENKRINNLAAITGGYVVKTAKNGNSDEFSDSSTTSSSMVYGSNSDLKGDMCYGYSTIGSNGGQGPGNA